MKMRILLLAAGLTAIGLSLACIIPDADGRGHRRDQERGHDHDHERDHESERPR